MMQNAQTMVEAPVLTVRCRRGFEIESDLGRLEAFVLRDRPVPLSCHPGWLSVLRRGLRHETYCLEAVDDRGTTRGILPLAHVSSLLFGRFLVSLPYLNYGGVVADDEAAAMQLIDRAVKLADDLGVRYLELRQQDPVEHPKLSHQMATKAHMRLELPQTSEALWKQLSAKVRNQVRKGQKSGLTVTWGRHEALRAFHKVFSRNMRDLGTPSYGRKLFAGILEQFADRAELCVVIADGVPVAGALLLHGWGVTEVPSASCLRQYNHTCANMLMYWQLLERAIERKQEVFDFGRSSRDSNTYRFKEQWGALPAPATWQYYLRQGTVGDMRPEHPRYQRLVRIWQRLPLAVTRLIGPSIVRGIP
ncbi:MAG: FemAB family PEP-CTERM system-associated protein [Gemmataceae bacterium]|nr:FemAB family PEP-CTERM system-associated protein [Gemmataceae bacterium]